MDSPQQINRRSTIFLDSGVNQAPKYSLESQAKVIWIQPEAVAVGVP